MVGRKVFNQDYIFLLQQTGYNSYNDLINLKEN